MFISTAQFFLRVRRKSFPASKGVDTTDKGNQQAEIAMIKGNDQARKEEEVRLIALLGQGHRRSPDALTGR
jgi:hypothetical protein